MKKQYRCQEDTWCKKRLYVYHDGELIQSQSFYIDEIEKEINKLKSNGYIYGYTKEEIKEAKERYEIMLRNIIQ